MKIRAVTLGLDLPEPDVVDAPFVAAGRFLAEARQTFSDHGVEVETTRLSGGEVVSASLDWALQSERAAREHGIEYLSIGRFPASADAFVADELATILARSEILFASADLIQGRLPSVKMAEACARLVKQLATRTELGFGNLRFAATASCPPNIPFFPAGFHVGGPPRFSIAVEAADIVVSAFAEPGGMSELEDRLVRGFEAACEPVERVAETLAQQFGCGFVGLDLSPAPFPADDASIGAAIERAGVDRFGAPGTLYVAALITRAIRRTQLPRCGFSGLMLPLLEDSVLARRAAEHPSTVHELLLYSAVCGTGLDTIPLPGGISETELAGIYLDVAALSAALDGKPLTVRLMPVPGAAAGDPTTFTFDYFANSRVLPRPGAGAAGILERGQ